MINVILKEEIIYHEGKMQETNRIEYKRELNDRFERSVVSSVLAVQRSRCLSK